MKKQILVAVALLPVTLLNAQSWAGRYTQVINDENNKQKFVQELFLMPADDGASVDLTALDVTDGTTYHYDTDYSGIPVNGNKIQYYYPDEEIDYSIVFELEDGCVRVTEYVDGGISDPEPGKLSVSGVYIKDNKCFADGKSYLYQLTSSTECKLAKGGLYIGDISVPEKVKDPSGRTITVTGIDFNAFKGNYDVTSVALANDRQRVDPGAFNFTRLPFDRDKVALPRYVYPDESLTRFVSPEYEAGKEVPETALWLIFKQNYAPIDLTGDFRGQEDRKCGMALFDFDNIQGLYYNVPAPKKNMFKGYDRFEIEALVAGRDFAAFHTFPSYSRWKYPEKEKDAPGGIVRQVAKKYGRTVKYSRKVAWLRDGTGEFDIVEFEHTGGEAMVVYVWSSKGEIYATGTFTAQLRPGEEDFSVWNVDDDGYYGIPDVVSIAIDPEGRVTLFLAKNSPESVDCFALRQVEDRLERIDLAMWYRYID